MVGESVDLFVGFWTEGVGTTEGFWRGLGERRGREGGDRLDGDWERGEGEMRG